MFTSLFASYLSLTAVFMRGLERVQAAFSSDGGGVSIEQSLQEKLNADLRAAGIEKPATPDKPPVVATPNATTSDRAQAGSAGSSDDVAQDATLAAEKSDRKPLDAKKVDELEARVIVMVKRKNPQDEELIQKTSAFLRDNLTCR